MPVALQEMGGGGKSWSPEQIGEKIEGKITLAERRQQRSFDGGAPLTWDDGSPRMLTYLEVQTGLHEDDDDDGVRAFYAKGGRNFEPAQGTGTSAEVAIAEAVKAAGSTAVEEGGTIAIMLSGIAKATQRGFQGAKLYRCQYKAPVSSVSVDDLFSNDG
jgi:hypothetical protein